MKKLLLPGLVTLLALTAGALRAETVTCPELAAVVQSGACPSEEDLRFTFQGYCSDSQRMYDQGPQLCLDFETYRRAKNISRWESADGKFDGYLRCDQSPQQRAQARANGLKISTQGSVTRVVCSYGGDVVLSHRTKAKCVADPGNCSADPAACKASCE